MNKEPQYHYDKESHEAMCILTYGELTFVGKAVCHPEDFDFESEKTGYAIAHRRALIKYFQHVRDNELKPGLKALEQLYYSINRSKNFDPKNYENRMLRRQICLYKNDLAVVSNALATERSFITSFIKEKDKFYEKMRILRDTPSTPIEELLEKAKNDQSN